MNLRTKARALAEEARQFAHDAAESDATKRGIAKAHEIAASDRTQALLERAKEGVSEFLDQLSDGDAPAQAAAKGVRRSTGLSNATRPGSTTALVDRTDRSD